MEMGLGLALGLPWGLHSERTGSEDPQPCATLPWWDSHMVEAVPWFSFRDHQPTLASWFHLPAVDVYQPLPPSHWGLLPPLLLTRQTLQNRAGKMHKYVLTQQMA